METIVLNEMRERFNRAMLRGTVPLDTQENLDTFKRRLSDLPSETVYFLGEIVSDESIDRSEHTLDGLLIYMLGASGASHQEMEDVAFLYLHNAIDRKLIKDTLSVFPSSTIPSAVLRNALSGLRQYNLDRFTYDSNVSIGRQDQRTREQCIALVSVGRAVKDMHHFMQGTAVAQPEDTDPTFLYDQRLAQLVVDSPDHHRIPLLLQERGGDVEAVRAVLEAPSRALSEGIL